MMTITNDRANHISADDAAELDACEIDAFAFVVPIALPAGVTYAEAHETFATLAEKVNAYVRSLGLSNVQPCEFAIE